MALVVKKIEKKYGYGEYMQFAYLKHDIYRYLYPSDNISHTTLRRKLKTILFTQGIWATIVYRFRRWTLYECPIPLLRKILSPFGDVMNLIVEITTGIHIKPEIDIGPGLYIGHFGNIFLGGQTSIGKFANISQGVTIGFAGRGDKWGLPVIGDFVYIAPGAKVIGMISIGNNVAIGANAVVNKDLPDNAVAVGVPAKIINYHSSRGFIRYNSEKNKAII